jgi:ligand-binding sensor domain-containing protein/signal transduction histidine kinase
MLNGFPGGQVNGVAQTKDGYLWVGTDRGLFRFDGLNFVDAHELAPFLSSTLDVLDLSTDNEGSLWIRLEHPELLRYRDGSFEDYFAVRQDKESGVVAMNHAQNGDLLVSALIHGKLRYSNGEFHSLVRSGPSTSLAISIAETPDGRVWVGTRDEGLYWVRDQALVPAPGTLPDKKVNALVPAANGRLWVGTDNGLAVWDGSETTTSGIPSNLQKIQILNLFRDRDDNLWIGTPRGLFRLDPEGVSTRDPVTASVTAIFEDREGNLWVGSPQGLQRLRDSAFVSHTLGSGTASPGGGPVYVDPEGRAWVAPSTGGLYSMFHGKVTRITSDGLDHDVIYSIDGGPNDLWLGRQRDGLTHLRIENGAVTDSHTYTRTDGLPQNRIFAVHRNPDGSAWAATLNDGICLVRSGKITTFTTASGLPSNSVTAVESTPEATWFGTPMGLVRLQDAESPGGAHWRTFTYADGLPSDDIISLLSDSAGSLWIGTSSGLALLRSGHIQPLRLPAGLREPIFGIAEDRHGALWIATSTRLLTIQTSSLLSGPASLNLREYGSADGLPGTETVRRNRSVVADSSGRIWFSLNQGLASINPERAFAASTPALTHIESIAADGTPLHLDASFSLPASTRRLMFDYAGVALGVPERVRYRYRLDGFDHDWSGPVSARQAVYTNLGPGDYRFRVLSSNSDGQWGTQEATYSFRIAPAVWQTWWFQLSLVAALGILTTLIFRWRMLHMAERLKLRFEERLAERTRIAQELHDTLLQGFLSASMQLHVAAEQLPPESPARGSIDRILELMQQVNQEGRNTLRGLRSDSGALTLEQALSRVPSDLSPTDPPTFRVIAQGPSRLLHPVIRDEAIRIGREAIVNAFLHSRATSIEVEIEYTASHLRLCVRDDGVGIDPEVLRCGREGHWGLIGMRERAGHISATLKVFSRIEAGTEVELTVPGHIAYQNPVINPSLSPGLRHLWARLRRNRASL